MEEYRRNKSGRRYDAGFKENAVNLLGLFAGKSVILVKQVVHFSCVRGIGPAPKSAICAEATSGGGDWEGFVPMARYYFQMVSGIFNKRPLAGRTLLPSGWGEPLS